MEKVQFHPTGMVIPEEMAGTLVTEAVRGEGGKLINNKGERFMSRYDPERMELSTRDKVAIANYTEIKDAERLKKYALKATEAVEKYSGKLLARSANNITLDGREMVRVALAEFPDIETAKKCYDSEEYVEARKHLENNATREHIIFEGM